MSQSKSVSRLFAIIYIYFVFVYHSIIYAQSSTLGLDLIYHIPNQNLKNALEDANGKYIELSPMCIDSIKKELAVGMLIFPREYGVESTKIIFVSKTGKLLKQTNWIKNLRRIVSYPQTFRYYDSSIYISGNDLLGCKIDSMLTDRVKLVWHPDEMRKKYSFARIGYDEDVESGKRPLFHMKKNNLVAIDSFGLFHIYDFTGKIIRQGRIRVPWINTTQGSDLLVGIYDKNAVIYDPPFDLMEIKLVDPLISKIYHLTNLTSNPDANDLRSEAELVGISFYLWNDTPYFIFYAKKGIYVFRFRISED